MKRIQRVNLIDGPILPALLSFAFPILLSNIFQQVYNISDVMIVGRFLGQRSLAAVGATSAIFDLIVGFSVGVGNGMGIIIARNYGAKNEDQLRKSVAATAMIGGVLSLLVMLIGAVGLYPLLQFLGTPSVILAQSYLYISTIVNGVAVSFAYNLCAGLLRAVGDSLASLLLDYRRHPQHPSGPSFYYPAPSWSPVRWNCDYYCSKFLRTSLFLLYPQKGPFSSTKSKRFCLGSKDVSGFNQPRTNHGTHVFDCLYRNRHLTISYQ